MMNLYYNNISSSQKTFEYVNSKKLSKYFNVCYLMIKDFWKELYTNKELVYKIIKYGNKEEDLMISNEINNINSLNNIKYETFEELVIIQNLIKKESALKELCK